jgi:fatty-acyl-CoA synthase
MHNFQTDWLSKWAYYAPEKFFLRENDRDLKWSFGEFNKRVNALAFYLTNELGIKVGDRIAVYSKNRAEYVQLFLACVKCGAILVPLNFRLTPRELDILISDADPSIFFFEENYSEQIKNLNTLKNIKIVKPIEEISPFLVDKISAVEFVPQRIFGEDDVVMILYTAGTTGLSKGVKINHRMLFWNAVNTCLRLDI